MPFPDIDVAAGTVTLAIWQSAILAGLLLLLVFLAVYRAQWPTVVGPAVRLSLALFGIVAAWTVVDRLAERDRADERRALDQRILELSARALAPGSALGCLEPNLGETIDAACEKAVFADPETIAGATAYVAGSLSLLADAAANGWDVYYDAALAALRHRLEIDRFGLVAQVLAGEGCSAAKCEKLALFADANRVSANLKARTFENLVARNSAGWPQPASAAAPAAPVAAAPPPPEPSQPPSQTGSGPAPAAGPQKRPPAPARPAARAQTAPAAPPIQIGPPPAANAGTEPPPQ